MESTQTTLMEKEYIRMRRALNEVYDQAVREQDAKTILMIARILAPVQTNKIDPT